MSGSAPPPAPPSKKTRWPGGDRAAVLFVGIPLAAALVLAADPLSEPPRGVGETPASRAPAPTGAAALPSRVLRSEPRAAWPPRVVVTPRTRGGGGGAAAVRGRAPLSIRSIVSVADGVERVEIQAP